MCRRIKRFFPYRWGRHKERSAGTRGRNEEAQEELVCAHQRTALSKEGNFTARTGKCGSRVRKERVDLIACMDIDEAAAARSAETLRYMERRRFLKLRF